MGCDFDDVNYHMRRGRLLKYIQEEQFKKISSMFKGSEEEEEIAKESFWTLKVCFYIDFSPAEKYTIVVLIIN